MHWCPRLIIRLGQLGMDGIAHIWEHGGTYFRYSSFFLSSCSLYNAIIICCRLFVWHFGPMLPKFLRLIDLNKTSSKDFSRHEFFITFSNSTSTVHNIFRNNSWWLTSVALILERTLWRKLVWILTTSWFWM